MDKKIWLIIVVAIIAILLGFIYLKQAKAPTQNAPSTNNSSTTSTNTNNSKSNGSSTQISANLPGMPGSMTVTVEKISGNQIFFKSQGKESSVTVDSSTTIVQQVNNKGTFTDQTIKLSDINPGQMIQITPGKSANTAAGIRVLQ